MCLYHIGNSFHDDKYVAEFAVNVSTFSIFSSVRIEFYICNALSAGHEVSYLTSQTKIKFNEKTGNRMIACITIAKQF